MARSQQVTDPAEIAALLAATPGRLGELSEAVPDETLARTPSEGEWSPRDVLAHLRACADVWGGCIDAMLAEEHPTLRAINPLTHEKGTDYRQQPFRASLAAYAAQREQLLALLRGLPAEAWDRSATVTGAGAPLERDVRFYASWLARHERHHLRWFGRLVGESQDAVAITPAS